MRTMRPALSIALVFLTGCTAAANRTPVRPAALACTDQATQIISQNASLITSHRYAAASRAAERAARVSLSCNDANPAQTFDNRWRGANALVAAAELAHEANDAQRAHRLLHEGYAIMNGLRPPRHMSDITTNLIAQKLDTARQDLAGQWAYW